MNVWKVAFLVCFLAVATPATAQQQAGKAEDKGGFLEGVMEVLGGAAKESLQETIDEFIGNYKGKLGEVELIERRGNSVVLEVTYDKVKRSDGVYVQGEVLRRGAPIEGFTNTLTPVSGRRGRVRLTISRPPADDWEVAPAEIESDQIELFLVREDRPDRHFGNIAYNLPKVWTASDELEERPPLAGEEEGIELAEDQTLEQEEGVDLAEDQALEREEGESSEAATVARKPPYISPGTVLQPAKKLDSTTTKTAHLAASAPGIVSSYDFYEKAESATWRSRAGALPFPGENNDRRGFVRRINRGRINPDNAAVNLLQTHPEWKQGGWIAGMYPATVLGENLRFRAVAGFLKGSRSPDGVTFMVQVYENGRYHRILRHKVSPARYVNLEGDLSAWAGKEVRLILRVDAGNSSAQDWAVWVKPRLSR
ncbi:MAG: hypothetical protein ACLFVT_01450 [Syntrophobacteria bacterium]